MSKILITGATGLLGGLVIDFLLQKGIEANEISALARSARHVGPYSVLCTDVCLSSHLVFVYFLNALLTSITP